jgi:hypothetical protein
MFGFIDILAIRGSETLGVQATSDSNVSARVKKIADSEHLPAVREAGWSVQVWGWKQARMYHPWTLRIVDIS